MIQFIFGRWDSMDAFSEKSLLSLGDYYVYGLIDPRTNQIFYIGKGTGNRVFEHEKESLNSPNSDKLKLKTISEINALGLDVKKIIINSNLTETEAFAAEAALINAFNYVSGAGLIFQFIVLLKSSFLMYMNQRITKTDTTIFSLPVWQVWKL